ncbi:MAG: hypothetical protein Q9190_006064 [Brigantiaea leucoxantha]
MFTAEELPLPRVAQALEPYIRSRHEILRIRQVLSLHTASSIQNVSKERQTSVSLALPDDDVKVIKIPPEITGIRMDYLKALQKHIDTKNEYTRISEELGKSTFPGRQREERLEDAELSDAGTTIEQLKQERQKNEKLRILLDYLAILASKDTVKPDFLNRDSVLAEIGPLPDLPSPSQDYSDTDAKRDFKDLILDLKKSVLKATNAAKHENQLLCDIQNQPESTGKCTGNPQARLLALTRTRNELIDWIETELANSTQSQDLTPPPLSTPPPTSQLLESIQKGYTTYLHARQTLVTLSSRQPPPSSPYPSPTPSNPQSPVKSRTKSPLRLPTNIPTSSHRTDLQIESHISHILASETRTTTALLEKLSQESHLLSNYPPPITSAEFSTASREEEAVRQARAWALAAENAEVAAEEVVRGRIEKGNEWMEEARGGLRGLKDLIGEEEGGIFAGLDRRGL